MMFDHLRVDMDPSDKSNVLKHLQNIESQLPFLISLTPQQRQESIKLSGWRRKFVDKAYDIAEVNRDYFKRNVNPQQVQEEYEAMTYLETIQFRLQEVLSKVDDTIRALHEQTWRSYRLYYRAVKDGSFNNEPGALALYKALAPLMGKGFGNFGNTGGMVLNYDAPERTQGDGDPDTKPETVTREE